MLPFALVIVGILGRLMPHDWNFTPILAVALFSGSYLNRRVGLTLPIVLMFITDIFLGFHATMAFTWGSIFLIAALGIWVRQGISFSRVFIGSFFAAVIFFIITNFGSWLAYYPRTWTGLVECYTLAIPFFRNSLFSSFIFSAILFSFYELSAVVLRNTRWRFLLTEPSFITR